MELEVAKKIIKQYVAAHVEVVARTETAERYYQKKNDIMYAKKPEDELDRNLRTADNRVASNFHKLLVNQEAAYAFTAPPLFDVKNDGANKRIQGILGDAYAKKCKSLCVKAQNGGIAWVHYWKDKDHGFRYAVLDSKQVIPIWSSDLEENLSAVVRIYTELDDHTGDTYAVYQIWTQEEAQSFRKRVDDTVDGLENYRMFHVLDIDSGVYEMVDSFRHEEGEVPFIPFLNNEEATDNLQDIKQLIDAYDKVYSGFVNDLEDIQEIILVLTNYGGEAESVSGLWNEIKQKKIIQVESDGADDKSGVSTLAIEIPVEAREKMITITRKAIFEQGQGIDPDPQNFGNSSGVALSYLYSLLELKTGMMETEFRMGFGRLVRAICRCLNVDATEIIQTWTRTSVSNDVELADIASKSKGIISDETITKNHPWVEDPTEEMKLLEKQQKENEPKWDRAPVPAVKISTMNKEGEPNGEK